MTKDEALKLALEALESVLDDSTKLLQASISGGLYEVVQCRDAITAIKEALAQPEPSGCVPTSPHKTMLKQKEK
jgi:20S proteasome alpha/beta subunit